ncbi:MAG TPA: tRNA-dihydrouridine synthase [Candidatus Paceibacterota bacterium]|nr:tRNA-dihydrouridine synthase [Candidatus Paceibacterota bacterium]
MAIAPMANVTDAAFRRMFVECNEAAQLKERPVFWTEFVSVEGLLSKGKEKLLVDFWYDEREHPIVAQIFGSKPEQFEAVGPLIRELGFDGVDINMGCPDRAVEKQGSGAALIKNPALAKEIIRATKRGVGDMPVSVKTRIGYAKDELETWVPALLDEGIAALTMHLRTRNEMSDTEAHWDLAPKLVALRDKYAPQTFVLGNGDVDSLSDAKRKVAETGLDGAMIGRGIFGSPWFFSGHAPDTKERLEKMVEHAEFFEKLYRNPEKGMLKSFDVMKKHFKAYVSGFDGSKELRIKLMETHTSAEVRRVTEEWLRAAALAPQTFK